MQVNKRILVSIGILGGATLILYGAIVVPSVLAIKEANAKITEEHANIERRYLLRNIMRRSLSLLEDAKSQLTELSAAAIREGQELDFISALESAAAGSGVAQDIVLETVNQKDLSRWEKEVPLRLVVVGDYLRVLDYLRALERLPYVVIVDSLQIRTTAGAPLGGGSRGSPDVRAEIGGTVYLVTEDAPSFIK
jgi:Tfp pilus assembly protein PilO